MNFITSPNLSLINQCLIKIRGSAIMIFRARNNAAKCHKMINVIWWLSLEGFNWFQISFFLSFLLRVSATYFLKVSVQQFMIILSIGKLNFCDTDPTWPPLRVSKLLPCTVTLTGTYFSSFTISECICCYPGLICHCHQCRATSAYTSTAVWSWFALFDLQSANS